MKSIEVTSVILKKKFQSKSSLIKTLYFEKNVSIKEIAEKEQIRYQQVRNIVVNEKNSRIVRELNDKE